MLSNELEGKATTRTATYGPFAGVSADLGVLSPVLIAESWRGVPRATPIGTVQAGTNPH
jgi:hypothetical protein